jgi:hypothetical protein
MNKNVSNILTTHAFLIIKGTKRGEGDQGSKRKQK